MPESSAAATRQSIEVPGLGHGALPIPVGSVVGGLLVTGGINGKDPSTGQFPDSLEDEVAQVYRNVVAVLAAAGFGTDDVAKMTFFVGDRGMRELLNPGWVELFPDPAARPARHTLVQDLPGATRVQADVLAFRDSHG